MVSKTRVSQQEKIVNSLSRLKRPGEVTELRILHAGSNGTLSGYYDDLEALARDALKWSGKVPGVYFTINPVSAGLLARSNNKLTPRAKSSTADDDVIGRDVFFIDVDAVRPTGISSNNAEHQAALYRGRLIKQWLKEDLGWPDGIMASSGNGCHLYFKIDLPNDEDSKRLVKGCLEALALKFDDDRCDIDAKVFNAARISKVFFTMTCKGENLEDRPHRKAEIIQTPENLETVTLEQLQKLYDRAPRQEDSSNGQQRSGQFDLQGWIKRHDLKILTSKPWQGGTIHVLETCPFNPEHGKDSSIIQQASGALGFQCFHNGCTGHAWHDLRDLLEPGWRERRSYSNDEFTAPAAADQWPDPEPITTTLLPVEQLPPEIIPEPFRSWAVDVAHRMQCPIDYIAAALLVMSGAIIGAGCGIRPKAKDDWLVVPNLWGGVIGRPGMLKTPALQEAMKPLAEMEAAAKSKYDDDTAFYEAEKEAFKSQREAIKAEMTIAAKGKENSSKSLDDLKYEFMALETPPHPTWQRFKTNDATIERMAELLQDNPRGILLFRDELVGLLTSWEKQGREPDRAFFLEAWNGYGSMTTDRIGRGTVHCNNLCVSILGGIQPAKLLAYLHQSLSEMENDGLMQRMQVLVYPDEPERWQYIDEHPKHEAKAQVFEVIKNLVELNPVDYGAKLREGQKIPYFHFDPPAQEIFTQWLTALQGKLQSSDDPPVILEHLNKYRSLMPSLALIDHLVKVADGKASGDIAADSVERAAAWCEFLESHARRIYGMVGDINQRAAEELAKKLKAGKLQSGFTIRDVYNRKSWHLLTNKETVKAACEELTEAGWLIQQKKEIPGRQPVKVYHINPKIFSSNEQVNGLS